MRFRFWNTRSVTFQEGISFTLQMKKIASKILRVGGRLTYADICWHMLTWICLFRKAYLLCKNGLEDPRCVCVCVCVCVCMCVRLHTSAYAEVRLHTSAYVTSAYVSIREHTHLACIVCAAHSVWGLKLLVYQALSSSVWGLKLLVYVSIREHTHLACIVCAAHCVWGLKLLVYQALRSSVWGLELLVYAALSY
jgi:hypothetical protein